MTQTFSPVWPVEGGARRLRLGRAGVVAASAAVAVVLWIICVPVMGLELVVGSAAASQTVGLAAVIVVPLLAGGAAWGLRALLERMPRGGRRTWLITSWAVLALSLLGPLGVASGAVLIALLAMHVAVGLTLIVGLSALAASAKGGARRRPARGRPVA
ncbi:DUF6069 family protein [Microbacterium sp. STN6]|uniref:DUF6069 family protein n=1 Tax=Microbacterium sp. STN6 TaxID=2995588 RepID=UPI002260AC3B|nr:DUF6069 family protein [Microbacterium sp. STN6]MCX7522722.1 DUF6069 family protein [Microbacterium sp. STN6]